MVHEGLDNLSVLDALLILLLSHLEQDGRHNGKGSNGGGSVHHDLTVGSLGLNLGGEGDVLDLGGGEVALEPGTDVCERVVELCLDLGVDGAEALVELDVDPVDLLPKW